MTDHVHASAIDIVIVIAGYIIFKALLALLRANTDDDNALIQAANAIQL